MNVSLHNIDSKELAAQVDTLLRRNFRCQVVKSELRPGEFRIVAKDSGKYALEYACDPMRKSA